MLPTFRRSPSIELFTLRTSALALTGLLILAGCGGKQGLERYSISGTVTFDGKNVPNGYLRFIPDKKQGNKGPGCSAAIIDGQFKTLAGQGTIGGPHLVKISGADGISYETENGDVIAGGRPLFPEYTESLDLPKKAATVHDFALTAAQFKGK